MEFNNPKAPNCASWVEASMKTDFDFGNNIVI